MKQQYRGVWIKDSYGQKVNWPDRLYDDLNAVFRNRERQINDFPMREINIVEIKESNNESM